MRMAGGEKTFASAVKGRDLPIGGDMKSNYVLVLGDECLVSRDLSLALLGKVKEFGSLANLKVAIGNEGFSEIGIKYMGELWVMLKFQSTEALTKFRKSVSTASWFSQIINATIDFEIEGRITWVEVEGVPLKLWSGNTSIKDEFNIIHKGKKYWIRVNETPGWVLDFTDDSDDEEQEEVESNPEGNDNQMSGNCFNDNGVGNDSDVEEVPKTCYKEGRSMSSKVDRDKSFPNSVKSEDPFKLYPLLNKHKVTDESVNRMGDSLKYPPRFTPFNEKDETMYNEGGKHSHNDVDVTRVSRENMNVVGNASQSNSNNKECGNELMSSRHFKKSECPRTGGLILGLLEEVLPKRQKNWVKELCIHNKVNFLALQETKMETMDDICVRKCWGNLVFDCTYSDSVGNSGDIICIWDPNSFSKHSVTVSNYFVIIRGTWRTSRQNFLMIAVYAPQDSKDKQTLWDFLHHEISKWKGEVIIMGDFNEVCFISDRFGSIFNEHGAHLFNSFISDSGLVEVPLGGCHFTWCLKSAKKMSKLDRFLVSKNLLVSCPHLTAITLERYLSDHHPILLRENQYDYGPTPFRFFHHWMETEGFDKIVTDSWKNSPCVGANAMKILINKLKYLKYHIREWNKQNTAKIKWAIEGDENSKFFHGTLNKKRNSLNIRGVMVDGVWVDDPKSVKREFLDHFTVVTNEEIKRAVWERGTDKAPGPDGFTFGFFRHFWHLVDKDVFNAVRYFFIHDDFPIGCNSSFIALIPKILNVNLVKDYRPISLIGSVYKIIAKILTNQLVSVLGGIVNEAQSAFVANRQILDGPFILNEVIQWCKAKKKQVLIFKVNFEKAYDSIRWDFLDDVLSLRMSFNLRVVDAGLFHGIKLHDTVNLSHLFYADDAVFVGQWSERNISTLTYVLECFHKASGLKINVCKSKIMGIRVYNENISRAAEKLGCQVLKSPLMYLGSMVGGNMHRLQSWDDTVDRVRKSLSKWMMKTLSSGGRFTLVKSVLGSMPIFHMSLFKVPSGILYKLESIRRHFFNGHEVSSKKISWVNWNKVWRFLIQGSSLWARVVKAIHGTDGNIGANRKGGIKSCWTNIINEINVLSNKGINLMSYLRITLGNGESTLLWDDPWHVEGILKDRLPRGGVENMQFVEFTGLMQQVILAPGSDRWTWTTNSSGGGMFRTWKSILMLDGRTGLLPFV
nr:RNA-directed DNA polymerase, eukaryota [Tanacetum cinerariifolium]